MKFPDGEKQPKIPTTLPLPVLLIEVKCCGVGACILHMEIGAPKKGFRWAQSQTRGALGFMQSRKINAYAGGFIATYSARWRLQEAAFDLPSNKSEVGLLSHSRGRLTATRCRAP